jgi:protein KRI1
VSIDEIGDDDDDVSDESASSSEEEDEVGELVTPEIDAQIIKTLTLIRKGDPSVYTPDKHFFSGTHFNS